MMNSQKKGNREKNLAAITAIILAAGAIYTIVVSPQLERREKNLQLVRELELKLSKMKTDMLIKDQIDSIYSKVEPLITSDGSEQQDLSLFASELASLYSQLDVKIRSVKILPNLDETYYKRLSIKIEMFGSTRNIIDFIMRVETYENPIKIEQCNLKAAELADRLRAAFVISKIVGKPAAKI